MKSLSAIKLNPNIHIIEAGLDGGMAKVQFRGRLSPRALVIFSWGEGWDHVSVSFPNRCPSWDEMCQIKDMFFDEDECVVQYHPAKKDYVNRHPYCLHLWRPQGVEIVTPPKILVG